MKNFISRLLRLANIGILQWIICVIYAAYSVHYIFFQKGSLTIQMVQEKPKLFGNMMICYFSMFFFLLIWIFLWNLSFNTLKNLRKLQKNYTWHNQYSSSVLKFTEADPNPAVCLEQYDKSVSFFFNNPELASSVPNEENIRPFMNSVQIRNILQTLNIQDIQSNADMIDHDHLKFVSRLWKELLIEFPEQYLNNISELKLVFFMMEKSDSELKAFSQVQTLSNNYEFAIRIAFYLVADWCLNIYSEYYHLDKNIFFISRDNSEQENMIAKLNQIKSTLLNSRQSDHMYIEEIVTLEFSLQTQRPKALTGELPEIYHSCCSLLTRV